MPLSVEDRDEFVRYLNGTDWPEGAASRSRVSDALLTTAESIAAIFSEVITPQISALQETRGETRRSRLLGYVERVLQTIPITPPRGWASLIPAFDKFVRALPADLKSRIPVDPQGKERGRYMPAFRALSLETRLRFTAATIRAKEYDGQALTALVMDLLQSAEERPTFLAHLREDLQATQHLEAVSDTLKLVERLPVIRRGSRYTSVYFKPPVTGQPKKGRVLVVEPDATLRRGIRLCLEDSGHTVLETANGIDAQRAFNEVRADVILMELRLTGVTGLELLSEWRRLKPPPAVVAMSQEVALSKEFEVATYPGLKFLKKPVDLRSLLESVQASGPVKS